MNAEDTMIAKGGKPKKKERQEDPRHVRERKSGQTSDRRDDKRSRPPSSMMTNFMPLNKGSQIRTVPAGTIDIFRTSAWNSIETSSFRTGLNTGSIGSILAILAKISDFGQKMDTNPKQKQRFLCNFSLT